MYIKESIHRVDPAGVEGRAHTTIDTEGIMLMHQMKYAYV